jgi:uncharacterized protein (DUF1330 family)
MPAYVVVTIDIHDPVAYERYKQLAPPSIGAYGGKYLTRGGALEALEGQPESRRFVILEFPDMPAARRWHASAEYAPALALRRSCATSTLLLAEGLPEPFVPAPPADRRVAGTDTGTPA